MRRTERNLIDLKHARIPWQAKQRLRRHGAHGVCPRKVADWQQRVERFRCTWLFSLYFAVSAGASSHIFHLSQRGRGSHSRQLLLCTRSGEHIEYVLMILWAVDLLSRCHRLPPAAASEWRTAKVAESSKSRGWKAGTPWEGRHA